MRHERFISLAVVGLLGVWTVFAGEFTSAGSIGQPFSLLASNAIPTPGTFIGGDGNPDCDCKGNDDHAPCEATSGHVCSYEHAKCDAAAEGQTNNQLCVNVKLQNGNQVYTCQDMEGNCQQEPQRDCRDTKPCTETTPTSQG